MIKQYNKEINGIRFFETGHYSLEYCIDCSDKSFLSFCNNDEEILKSFFDINSSGEFDGIIFTNNRLIKARVLGKYVEIYSMPYSKIVYWERDYTIDLYEKKVTFSVYGNYLEEGDSAAFCRLTFDITDDYNAFEKLLVEKVSNNSK